MQKHLCWLKIAGAEMNIVWLSANRFGYELLKEAIKISGLKVKAVITLKAGSRMIMYDGIKNSMWRGFATEVFEVEKINAEKKLLKKLSPDFLVVCGWRQVISKDILAISAKGTIGFHPTFLPNGRGPAPIINTLLRGFKESGVTMFYMGKGLDDGDIIGQERFAIKDSDHAGDVYNKVIKSGRKLVAKYMPLIIKGVAPRMPQEAKKALVFDKPLLKNNRIDLEKESLEEVYHKIKALSYPYNGAYIFDGKKKLIIWKAELKEMGN